MNDEEIQKRFENIEERIKNLEEVKKECPAETKEEVREESLREFFNKYKIKSDTDKVLLIIYFLETQRGFEEVSIKEISECFKEIREVLPKNPSDKFYNLSKRGLIMPGKPDPKKINFWKYTDSGKKYLKKLENGNE